MSFVDSGPNDWIESTAAIRPPPRAPSMVDSGPDDWIAPQQAAPKPLAPAMAGGVDDWITPAQASNGPLDYAAEFGKGFAEGGKNLVAGALKGYGAMAPTLAQRQLDALDQSNAPADDSPEERAAYRARRAAIHPAEDVLAQRRTTLQERAAVPVADQPLYRAGQAIEDFGKDALAPKPGFEGSWTRDIGAGFGSMTAGLATSLIPGLGPGTAATIFLGAGSGEAIDKALKEGATEAQARQAAELGTIAGATDMVDMLLPHLGSTGKALGFLRRVGTRLVYGALTEGGQEGVQQIIQNMIAQGVYKPDQDLMEDVPRSVAIGMIVGGVTSGGFAAADRGHQTSTVTPEQVAQSVPGGGQTTVTINGRTATSSGIPAGAVPAETVLPAASPPSSPPVLPPISPSNVTAAPGVVTPDEQIPQENQQRPPGVVTSPVPNVTSVPTPSLDEMLADPRPAAALRGEWEAQRRTALIPDVAGALSQAVIPSSIPGMEGQSAPHPNAERLLAFPGSLDQLGQFLSDNGIHQVRPLPGGYGLSSIVLDAGNHAVRISPASARTLPQIPEYVKPIATFEAKGLSAEILPKLDTASVTPADVALMQAHLAARRLLWRDAAVDNLGVDQAGNLLIIDGGIERIGDGTREAPVKVQTGQDLDAAAQIVDPNPSPAQKGAENYQMAHAKLYGLDISIETPKGGTRVAKDGSWSVPNFPAHYGRIKATKASDGELVDIFVGPQPRAPQVFVIDQVDPDSPNLEYDEAKVMAGFPSEAVARAAYEAAFPDGSGPMRIGAITPMSVAQFKSWVRNGDTTKPLAYEAPRAPRKPVQRGPLSLFEFLAQQGGIQDHGGELRQMGLDQAFIPGFGRLVRPTGRPLDMAREAAVEAGYLQDRGHISGAQATTTIADLTNLLDQEHRGEKVYSQQDMQQVAARQNARDLKEQARQYKEAEADVRAVAKAEGLIASDLEVRDAARAALEQNLDSLDALVDTLERNALAEEQAQVESGTHGEADTTAADAGSAKPAQAVQPARLEPQAAAGEAPARIQPGADQRNRGAPATEPTPAGQQHVLPGAERASDRDLAQRGADERLKPTVAQKPADTGLFGDESKQTDLVDLARRPDTLEKPPETTPHLIRSTPEVTKAPSAGPSDSGGRAAGVAKSVTPAKDVIEDFGQKIEGARKDTFAGFRDSLKEDMDVAAEPLSKSFPQPNYEKLVEEGVSKRSLAYIAIMRDMIPPKPRQAWKVRQWVTQVASLRSFARRLLDGDIDVATLNEAARKNHILQDLPLTAEAIEDVAPADLPKAAEYRMSSGSYSVLYGQRYSPSKTFWHLEGPKRRMVSNPFSNDPAMSYSHRDSPQEAVALAKKIIAHALEASEESQPTNERSKYTEVNVFRDRAKNEVFLGFKVRSTVIRLKAGFESAKVAREYLQENRDALQATIDEMRQGPNMRGAENRPRSGANLREGDVSPETFSDAFGFRGVQFGNYVEGRRRQEDLNRAFDALMDLADTLGVPPQALSLNGSLGLAFGARGHGGRDAAAAHYEPGQVVINLTKGGGPGSLAHEWLHALDNYFARQDAASGYISERKRDKGPVRDPVYQAWKAIEASLAKGSFADRSAEFDKARSKPYWGTTIEKAARAFERYVVDRMSDKGAVNDYLANIDTAGGAYPTEKEMQALGIRAAFDQLFNAIETKPGERAGTVAMYSLRPDNLTPAARERQADVERMLRDVIRRVAGRDVKVAFSDRIGTAQNLEGWGSYGEGREVEGSYLVAERLIALSHGAQNIGSTALHEAFHDIEAHLFTKTELAMMIRETPRLRKIVQDRFRYTDAEIEGQAGYEIRAQAFQAYAADRVNGRETKGLIPGIQRMFARLMNLLREIRNGLAGLGFNTAEDIFGKAMAGEFAGRKPRDKSRDEAIYAGSLKSLGEPAAKYVERLTAAVDMDTRTIDEPGFYQAWNELQADKTIKLADAIEIAHAYTGLTMPFKTKGDAFKEIRATFVERARFVNKLKAVEPGNKQYSLRRDPVTAAERQQVNLPAELIAAQLEARNLPKLAAISSAVGLGKRNATEGRVQVQDKSIRWKKMQEAVEEATGQPISEAMNVYMAESLYYGRTGQRLERLERDHIDPLIKEIKDAGLTLDDVNKFLMARHAPERNERIREKNPDIENPSGMSDEEAADILRGIDGSGERPIYDAIETRVRKIINDTRDALFEGGLINKDMLQAWENTYENYVPLRGFADKEIEDAVKDDMSHYGKGFDVRGPESKKALGRRSVADGPLGYVLLQAEQAIVRAEKAAVGRTAMRFVHSAPMPGLWKIVKGTPPYGAENAFALKLHGEPHYIEFGGEHGANLARALKNLGTANLHPALRFIGALTRLQARLATSWNPDFMVPNFVRDLGEAFINMQEQEQKTFVRQFAKHLRGSLGGSFLALSGKEGGKYAKAFREFDEAGGRIRFFGLENIDDIKSAVESKMRRLEGGTVNNILDAGESAIKAVEIANGAVENSTRLAVYMAGIDVGMTKAKSASVAREMTVNFNRKGELGSAISALYLFANASIQGSTRMLGAMRTSKNVRRGAYAIAAAGSMFAMYNIGAGGDDDDGTPFYLKLPSWERDTNMILMWPKGMGHDGQYVKIPLPYGYSFFHTIGARLMSMAYGKEKPAKSISAISKSVLDAFDPLGKDEGWLATATPSIARPVTHLATNQNWTGRPINPEPQPWNKHEPDSSRYFRSASPFAIWAAAQLNETTGGTKRQPGFVDVSPGTIDYMLKFVTGGLGAFVNNSVSTVTGAVQGTEWQVDKTPIVRRFYGMKNDAAERQLYFEERDKVMAAHAHRMAYGKDDDNANAAKLERGSGPELATYGEFFGADRQRANIRREIDEIKADSNFSAREKERRIKLKEREELNLMGAARKALEMQRAQPSP